MRLWTLHPRYLDARGPRSTRRLPETGGQLRHEWEHLMRKLRRRDRERWKESLSVKRPLSHPLFRLVSGGVRSWERA